MEQVTHYVNDYLSPTYNELFRSQPGSGKNRTVYEPSYLKLGQKVDWKKAVGSAVNGAITGVVQGAMIGSGVGLGVSLAANFAAGTLGSAAEQKISTGNQWKLLW